MQSYEHHVVHDSLEMRHPYIQDSFTSEIDPNQVSSPLSTRLTQLSSLIIDYNCGLR